MLAKRRLESLYAKQGRSQQYSTQGERDKALKAQISAEKATISGMQKQLDKQAVDIEKMNQSLVTAETAIADLHTKMEVITSLCSD